MNLKKKPSALSWRQQRWMGIIHIVEGVLIFFLGARAPSLCFDYIMNVTIKNHWDNLDE